MTRKMRRTVAAAGMMFFLAICLWFVPGVKFSSYLCAAIALALLVWAALCYYSVKHPYIKICKVLYLACVMAGVIGFSVIEAVLIAHGEADHMDRPADVVIVLGAGVNGTTPSLTLSSRIDLAGEYLERHPGIPAILSGGMGPGEEITEAEAMKIALVKCGIDEDRLILEEKSTSTAENFAYSKKLLAAEKLDTENSRIAVVSNDFHAVRVKLIAQREGMHIFNVSAELPWKFLSVNYYVREAFALVKTVLFD